MSRLFTSESVTEGHPDKIADQISDSILDALLAQDPRSRVACETFVTTGLALVGGEITTTAQIDYNAIIRERILEIGYDASEKGYDGKTASVQIALDPQSPDIAQGVDNSEDTRRARPQAPARARDLGRGGPARGMTYPTTRSVVRLRETPRRRLPSAPNPEPTGEPE